MINRRIVFAAICLAPVPIMAQAQAWAQAISEPLAIVQQIYKLSAGKNGKYEGNSAFFQPDVRKRWFAKSLVGQLAAVDAFSKKTGDVGVDFDPVTNSQDPGVTRLTITSESASASEAFASGSEAVVLAKFYSQDSKTPINVRYFFARENNAWKLRDMSGDNGGKDGWKLTDLLREIVK